MQHRTNHRILTTHAGSLPRPDELRDAQARVRDGNADSGTLRLAVKSGVAKVVAQQIEYGIDIINDGEFGKPSFITYIPERLTGFAARDLRRGEVHPTTAIGGREVKLFPRFFGDRGGVFGRIYANTAVTCTGPVQYVGQDAIARDIANLKEAVNGARCEGAFMTAVSPGCTANVFPNEHYANKEDYLFALADALHEEYKAITDAGFTLQIDGPDLADSWQVNSGMTVSEYRKFAEVQTAALNHALRDSPPSQVRFHMCWGSWHGPHTQDISLADIVEVMLTIRADDFSVEAANPRHELDWQVWEKVRLPDGKRLVPGVVGHAVDHVEPPELVAHRLVRYAELVGRENVIAGTDCGMSRVHPEVCWAKLESLAAGARLASHRVGAA